LNLTYHLEPLLHGGSALKVGGGGVDVVVDGLLGQINHVGGEEGLAVQLEVSLIGIEHTIEPREELLGAVIGVKDDGDVVGSRDATDVVGSGNGTGNGGLLAVVAHTLTSEESGTTLGDLQNNGAVLVTSSLEGRDNSGRGGDVLEGISTKFHERGD
jgi:hypothetical protein